MLPLVGLIPSKPKVRKPPILTFQPSTHPRALSQTNRHGTRHLSPRTRCIFQDPARSRSSSPGTARLAPLWQSCAACKAGLFGVGFLGGLLQGPTIFGISFIDSFKRIMLFNWRDVTIVFLKDGLAENRGKNGIFGPQQHYGK